MGRLTAQRWPIGLSVMAVVLAPALAAGPGVSATRHNLSVTGPGQVRAASETEVCIFCHASHVDSSVGPLWNRSTNGGVSYRPYESGTMASRPGQPDGSTRMCLSCHDGTIAVGAVGNRSAPIDVRGGSFGHIPQSSGSNLGTDLAGTHPVSFDYDSARSRNITGSSRTRLKTRPEPVDSRSLLDAQHRVQCTTCHDAHRDPAAEGHNVPPFWRGTSFEELCTACHDAPVAGMGHSDNNLLPRGCGSCHVGHGVARQPLLAAVEEDACYACHGSAADLQIEQRAGRVGRHGTPASVEALFERPYRHPVAESTLLHVPGEQDSPGPAPSRHVECTDCHGIHGDRAGPHRGPMRYRGAGDPVEVGGRVEHDLCYDCHGSGGDLPYGETDKSAEFSPSNESFHPIEAPNGKRAVPSLLSPWVPGDIMSCGDCHGSDDPDDPPGPHGSRNQWILRARYEATDGSSESATTYAACYGCHSRDSILSNDSFEGHNLHVSQERESCYACHDSHGVPDAPGLVRFGKDFRYSQVMPSSSGRLSYRPAGGGLCYLSCHGVDHDPLGYP